MDNKKTLTSQSQRNPISYNPSEASDDDMNGNENRPEKEDPNIFNGCIYIWLWILRHQLNPLYNDCIGINNNVKGF